VTVLSGVLSGDQPPVVGLVPTPASGTLLGDYELSGGSPGAGAADGAVAFLVVAKGGTVWVATSGLTSTVPESALPGVSVGPASGILVSALVLKGAPVTLADLGAMVADPASFVAPGSLRGSDLSGLDDAYLVFSPQFVSADSPFGVIGGTPDPSAGIEWYPLPGEFLLTSGYMMFPTIAPSFLRIEMTNLVPGPASEYVPAVRNVLLASPLSAVAETPPSGSLGAVPVGTATAMTAGDGVGAYSASALLPAPIPPAGSVLATETLVSGNPAVAQGLAEAFFPFGFVDWHNGASGPVSPPGPSSYEELQMVNTNQIGFVCGLVEVFGVRVNPASSQDRETFTETFSDTLYFGPVSDAGTV